jgi:hypothetical protein
MLSNPPERIRERAPRRKAETSRRPPPPPGRVCRPYLLAACAWLPLGASPAAGLLAEEVFVDVTRRAGIQFIHVNGATGKKYLPESMIGGAGWIDYDGDGHLDLYLVQGHGDSERAAWPGRESNVLYRNRGNGTFEEVTEKARAGDRGYGSGVAVGDIDNDGHSDLYVTNFGRNVLYRNNGDGTFSDITDAAGVGCTLWSASAAFADIDGDGLLDLYVANYLYYDPAIHKACTGNPKKIPGYCHPNKYDGAPDVLYLNRGGGRFEDISKQAGIAVSGRILSKGLGVLPTDFDLDGDIDFFVANDSVPNFLWRNLGGGRFEDAALEAGVALDSSGRSQACMGIDGGDVNGDGHFDYFITNFSEETDVLYLGEGDGFFADGTHRSGLAEPTFVPLGFGTKFFDYDLDGDLDIYKGCGHILDNVELLHPGTKLRYGQPDQLFANDGKGSFQDVSLASGKWFQEALVARAAAFADFDGDGDVDLFVVNCGQRGVLLENRSADSRRHHWLGLELRGTAPSNRDAYGSIVRVEAGGKVMVMEVRSAASYLAANDPRLVIGLGISAAPVKRVSVRWPDGLEEEFRELAPDRYHRLVRGGAPPR